MTCTGSSCGCSGNCARDTHREPGGNMFGRRSTNPDQTPLEETPMEPANDLVDAPAAFEELWSPAQAKARKSVEQLLLERGHISEEQLTQAKQVQSQTPGK